MATPDRTSDEASARFALLEMDAPKAPTSPASRPAPAPTPGPAPEPTALEQSRALLTIAATPAALEGAVRVIVARYPDANHPVRAALRPVYRERMIAIVALWWNTFLATWRGIGLQAWAQARVPAPAAATVAAVTATEVAPPHPHRGEYRKHAGEWRGWIQHTGRAVRPGDRIVLVRRNGAEAREYVRRIILGQYNGGCLVEFGAAPEAPAAQPASDGGFLQALAESSGYTAPEQTAAPETSSESSGTLLGALGAVASESATNATTQVSGSLADGTMRGVGFSTATGYVTALANGVKRATADHYLAILRNHYGYNTEQINALTVTIIAESALPVGAGIVHQPAGPDVFTQRQAAAAAAAQELRSTADATTLALAQRLVTDDTSLTAWWAIGWRGNGSITRAELLAACGDAPAPKVPSTQLGRVMDSLRGQNYDCARIESKLPAGVKVRWQIGRGKDHVASVGGEYGRVLAIVDLQDTSKLAFDGDQLICDEVNVEFERLIGEEILRPGDVTTWLQRVLRDRYGAICDGHDYLVAPKHREAARAFFTAVAKVWGSSWKRGGIGADGMPVLGRMEDNIANILGGILQGLIEEVEEQEHLWRQTVETADKRAEKVGARAAATALKRLDGEKTGDGLVARVNGFTILGEGPLAPLRARVAALRSLIDAAVLAANDDLSVRAAMLELD